MSEHREIMEIICEANGLDTDYVMNTGKYKRPPLCHDCGKHYSDPPSKLCPGCQAYKEHQS